MAVTYDNIANDYAAFVDAALADPQHILSRATQVLLIALPRIAMQQILDLGCGEGHLARRLTREGAFVEAVDTSPRLLELAAERSAAWDIGFHREDAQRLGTFEDRSFDAVVSNFALMDIPDLAATCASVYRVLRTGGRFAFSITHPCFQLPRSEGGDTDYFREGFWTSEWKAGIRGRVGAHHRTLGTYLNALAQAGFKVEWVLEPRPPGESVPDVLVVAAVRLE